MTIVFVEAIVVLKFFFKEALSSFTIGILGDLTGIFFLILGTSYH